MDVVYIVRPGDDNEELRHSLRSLDQNYQPDRVVIAGYMPNWVTNVKYIPVEPPKTRHKVNKVLANIFAAIDDPDVTDDFVFMNDDIFFLHPTPDIPRLNRGPFDRFVDKYSPTRSKYGIGAKQTLRLIRHFCPAPLCYALHAPMVINKDKFLEALSLRDKYNIYPIVPHYRTLYGNYVNYGGQTVEDFKVIGRHDPIYTHRQFASTLDSNFNHGWAGRVLRRRFPTPCKYEADQG